MDSVPAKLAIDDTFGAAFLGAMITAMLYGLTTLQTYFYYMFYPKDSSANKFLVASIWILDTIHMALVTISIYHYLVSNYANPPALGLAHWSLITSVLFNVIIACVVQSFFTLRIFYLSREKVRWWLTSTIGIIVLAHLAFGVETVIFFYIKKELAKLPDVTLFAAMPFAIFAVLSDIAIAGTLCVLLHGSRTGMRKTNMMVTTLIIYSINRCLLTSVVAVIEVIIFSLFPHSLWFLAIDFVIGKLYANSLLATLNSRQALRGSSDVSSTMNSVHLSDMEFEHGPNRSRNHVLDLRTSREISSRSTRITNPDKDVVKDGTPASTNFIATA